MRPIATSHWREHVGYYVAAVSALLLVLFVWQVVRIGNDGQGDRIAIQRERNALRATRSIVAVLASVSEYRDATADGDPRAIAATRTRTDAAFTSASDDVVKFAGGLGLEKVWRSARSEWTASRMKTFHNDGSAAPVFRALQRMIDAIEEQSGLIYDPNFNSQNLADAVFAALPRGISTVARSRAIAREGLRGTPMSLHDRIALATLVQSLRGIYDLSTDHVDDILAQLAVDVPGRASAFAGVRESLPKLARDAETYRLLVSDGVLMRNRPTISRGELVAQADSLRARTLTAFDGLANALDVNLERLQRLNDRRNTYVYLVVLAGAALVVGLMLSVAGLFARRDRRLLAAAHQESARLATELARQQAESALRLTEAQFRAVFDGAAMGIAILDGKRQIVEANDMFRALFGDRPERVFDGHEPELQDVMAGQRDAFEYEYHSLGPGGRELWAHATISRVADERGGTPFAMCMVRDITALKRSERRAAYDKTHDRLTGLPNRAVLEDRLRGRFADGSALNSVFAVLFVDLDRFKDVNESLGHAAGDFVLTTVAGRLRASVDADDVVARLGSDEFAILVQSLGDTLHVEAIARRIVANLARPVDVSGRTLYVGGSVGVAIASPTYEQAEDIMRDADIAMQQAKAAGGGRYAVFDATMHAQAARRLELTTDLRSALDRQEFRMLYQPIVDLATGELTACEALIRWEHPRNGLMSPNEFMPLAEQTGFARAIGTWVIRTACEQLAKWEVRYDGFLMHVNVSAGELVEPDFAQRLEETVAANRLTPEAIVLEITENVVLDVGTRAHASVEEVRDRGYKICIDDFGTGYSSLRYLQQFTVDSIKIDRTFVAGADGELASGPIVNTLLALAESYDVRVVAEGVETERQAGALRASGCKLGQGYLYARPMAAADLAAKYPGALGERVVQDAPARGA